MAFATRSKFFWSRFIATIVKYLGVANTQHIRYIAEKILPTDLSRQNILYHVRIAEQKGWIATFASSLEVTEENKILFRPNFVKNTGEKLSAQRFVIMGTENFEPEMESKIKNICKKANIEPISLTDDKIISLITEDSLKRLSSNKPKAKGNSALFMALLRFAWYWLSINPVIAVKIVQNLKNNESKHNYNDYYRIDVELLEIVSLIEMETMPEIGAEEIKTLLNDCFELADSKQRVDLMNLMAMVLLISARVLIANNYLTIAIEFLNRGIKYLRFRTRKSILMRKMHVDGLFDLGFIYSQQGWFHKALGVYENIARIIDEEFKSKEPIDNHKGRLLHAKAELYLMMAWPAYIFEDQDYRPLLIKSLRSSRRAFRVYSTIENQLKMSETNLLSAWACALLGRMNRAEFYLNKGSKGLVAPVPPKLNALYYNAKAEIYRKQEKYRLAIKNITLSFDYLKMLGYIIFKLFCMTRLAAMHVQLAAKEGQISLISYGNMSELFVKGNSDMINHVFIEFNKQITKNNAIITFYANENLIENHPEIKETVEYLEGGLHSSALMGESFTIIPKTFANLSANESGKIVCITSKENGEKQWGDFAIDAFMNELEKFDSVYQELLSKS